MCLNRCYCRHSRYNVQSAGRPPIKLPVSVPQLAIMPDAGQRRAAPHSVECGPANVQRATDNEPIHLHRSCGTHQQAAVQVHRIRRKVGMVRRSARIAVVARLQAATGVNRNMVIDCGSAAKKPSGRHDRRATGVAVQDQAAALTRKPCLYRSSQGLKPRAIAVFNNF